MTQATTASHAGIALDGIAPVGPKLDVGFDPTQALVFFGILAAGLFFVAYSLYVDITTSGVRSTNYLSFVLLGVALLIALGFEFVNGFHDTANAVATVIYTHSMPAQVAVVWSGVFNFLGVLTADTLDRVAGGPAPADPRGTIRTYLRTRQFSPEVMPALAQLARDIKVQIEQHGSLRLLPAATVQNVRNDMYLASETIRRLAKDPAVTLAKADADLLKLYKSELDVATRFIPVWVKVAVAIALGLGTMVGWKRIVITVLLADDWTRA
jgi:hypothetical protein